MVPATFKSVTITEVICPFIALGEGEGQPCFCEQKISTRPKREKEIGVRNSIPTNSLLLSNTASKQFVHTIAMSYNSTHFETIFIILNCNLK